MKYTRHQQNVLRVVGDLLKKTKGKVKIIIAKHVFGFEVKITG